MRQAWQAAGRLWICGVLLIGHGSTTVTGAEPQHSIARQWNEELLAAIRKDLSRPTVHARNLWHTSVAMWDAWAAYDDVARTFLHHERAAADDIAAAR
ncbi:MAG: hypothetical protein F9K43_23455, partial [Bauldia sp.]